MYFSVYVACNKSVFCVCSRQLLEYDVTLPEERLHQVADVVMKNSTSTLKELRRLFLVEDLVDSLKVSVKARNQVYFTVNGEDIGFYMHLACSSFQFS